jgi:hypothetical protein
VYTRHGYAYSPTIVIDLGVFSDHLFLRPSYQHYYFGDYYAPSYRQGGFYASFTFQTDRRGYDPIYAQQRWEHRQDRNWAQSVETSYQYRRDHESARPPRTWAAQRTLNPTAVASTQNRLVVATSIDQLAKRKDNPAPFQPVAKEERQKLSQRGQEVQTSRDQRRTLEAKAPAAPDPKPGAAIEPAKIQAPRSPIVAKPVSQLAGNQAPPAVPRAPQPEAKAPQPEAKAPQPEVKAPQPEAKVPPKAAPPTAGRPTEPGKANPAVVSRPPEAEKEAKPAPAPAASPAPARTEVPVRDKQEQPREKPKQAEAPPRAKEPAQPPVAAAAKPREEPQRAAKAPEPNAPQVSRPAGRGRPVSNEKGAAKLMRRDSPKEDKAKPAPPGNP